MATWNEREIAVRRIIFDNVSADPGTTEQLEGGLGYRTDMQSLRLDLGTPSTFINFPQDIPNVLNNEMYGCSVMQSSWDTAPADLSDAVDGDPATWCGTGKSNGSGDSAYIRFDMGTKKKVMLCAKLGGYVTAGDTLQVRWQYYNDDDSTWYSNSLFDCAQFTETAVAVRYTQMEYCETRYARLRFYNPTEMSASCRVYEAYAYNIEPSATTNESFEIVVTSGTVGWGGYVHSRGNIALFCNEIQSAGGNIFRYWFYQVWYNGSRLSGSTGSGHCWNDSKGDYAVACTLSRGMTLILDAHNWINDHPYDMITASSWEAWVAEWNYVMERYKNYSHIIYEIWNEIQWPTDTWTNSRAALYGQRLIDSVRGSGHDQPLLINAWWNRSYFHYNDPANAWYSGMHFYPGSSISNYSRPDNQSLPNIAADSGAETSVNAAFHTLGQSYDRAMLANPPLGWIVTEIGAGYTSGVHLEDPRSGGMAYVMRFLHYANSHNVKVIIYRTGDGAAFGETDRVQDYVDCADQYFTNASLMSPQTW